MRSDAADKNSSIQPTNYVVLGLRLVVAGVVVALVSSFVIFKQFSDGFEGSGLFHSLNLGFDGELALFMLPIGGALTAVAGLVVCVAQLVKKHVWPR